MTQASTSLWHGINLLPTYRVKNNNTDLKKEDFHIKSKYLGLCNWHVMGLENVKEEISKLQNILY